MSVLHSEPTGLQTTKHSFDFPAPPIHPQRIIEFEVGDHDHLFLGAFSLFDRNVEGKTTTFFFESRFRRRPIGSLSFSPISTMEFCLILITNGIFCSIRKRNHCVSMNSRSARSASNLLIPRRFHNLF